MAITIKDVADAAGVSTATVSRALRGLPNVDAATRTRIEEIAADLEYVISPSASRLATGRTGSIAVITPDIARWYFSTVLSGVESVLQAADIDLLLMSVGAGTAHRPMASRLRRRVDGVLVIAAPPQDPQLQEVLALGLPMSLIGLELPGVASVAIDDRAAGRVATQHLINLGHERIGVIGGEPVMAPYTADVLRFGGFETAMTEAGLAIDPVLITHGYFTMAGGERAMTTLLSAPNPPSAVFAMSDEMAFGAMRAMRSHGLAPGRDVSLIGIDGQDLSEYLDLTTVVQPVRELGRIAARALTDQLGAPGERAPGERAPGEGAGPGHVEPVRLATHLVVRGSTTPRRPGRDG